MARRPRRLTPRRAGLREPTSRFPARVDRLQNINAISNEVYVMQNGNLYTESQLLGPYANVNLNPTQSMSMTAVPPNQLIRQAI